MNRLKFKGSDQFYTGEVTPIGRNKVSIEFVGGIPKGIDTSLIEAFTPGGVKFLELTGFTTEYRRVDASLVLSNDGSVFVGEIIQEIDQEKALEDAKASKKNEMCSICNATIIAGCDVTVSGSLEHFRLTTDDQLNLFGKEYDEEDEVKEVNFYMIPLDDAEFHRRVKSFQETTPKSMIYAVHKL